MKAYKGFDKNLQCRGYQYEIGKEYKTDKADLFNCGFHACEFPMDVLSYYSPGDSRYCEVELEANQQKEEDSKRCGEKIKIGAEIGLKGIINASVKMIIKYAKESVTQGDEAHAATQGNRAHAATQGDRAHAATQGNRAHAATQGYRAHAATQGYRAHAATQGREAHAATQGDRAHAVAMGDYSKASVEGENSIACTLGVDGAAKGALGCWLSAAEYDEDCNVVGGRYIQVDGDKIKPDTYYTLKNGEFVEVQDE